MIVKVSSYSSHKAADVFALEQAKPDPVSVAATALTPIDNATNGPPTSYLEASPVMTKHFENTTIEEEAFLRRLGWSPSSSQIIEPLTDEEMHQWELKYLNLPKMADRRQQRVSAVTRFSFRHDPLHESASLSTKLI